MQIIMLCFPTYNGVKNIIVVTQADGVLRPHPPIKIAPTPLWLALPLYDGFKTSPLSQPPPSTVNLTMSRHHK